jgi:transposase-like protein
VAELLAERGLEVDRSCVWRRVQVYQPDLVEGKDQYMYDAAGSTGQTIHFLLTAHRDAAAPKRFFQSAFRSLCNPTPRVISVDKNPAYAAALRELKSKSE